MNKTLKRLLSYAKPFSRFVPKYIFVTIFGLIFSTLNFLLIIPLLKIIFDTNAYENIPAAAHSFEFSKDYFVDTFSLMMHNLVQNYGRLTALILVCIFVFITSFFTNFFRYWLQRILASMRTYVMRNMRQNLFERITRMDVGYFTEQRKGNLLSCMSNDITEVQNTIVTSFQVIFKDPVYIVGYMIVLFMMSYQLTLITVLALPLLMFFISRLAKRLKRKAAEAQELQGDILSTMEETVSGIRIVKAFNAQKHQNKHFDELNEQHRKVTKKMFYRQELSGPLSEFLGVSVAAIVLLVGGVFILNGEFNFGIETLIAYFGLYYSVLVPIKEVSRAYSSFQRGTAAADRIFKIIDTPVSIKKSENPISVKEFKNQIEFKNVSFKYEIEPVLTDINLIIPKGKMYALVGHSGAGKSTIADLIPRFYDVTAGEILIDGINVKNLEPKDLISLLGIVTQEAILFNDTVINNIAYGMENINEQDVIEAAKIANAHEFITNLENGYYTNIGDRGGKLSGGQRQRLAIARAVLKNPPILILDEATSALDTESERLVQDALIKLMKNRTSVVIAHRLSTIRNADQIIVLDSGKIAERGTHDELTDKNGIYRHLCDLQLLNK
ncbi:MAG: ABC transporter ATP-binding protein/permease [Prevotellaceae bacterium]|jgi:subfamily B ATP-binding cassette protein MsbA|nr:ABC transporter ATP-binding protein/permease [Prevotellaceae bacterium]